MVVTDRFHCTKFWKSIKKSVSTRKLLLHVLAKWCYIWIATECMPHGQQGILQSYSQPPPLVHRSHRWVIWVLWLSWKGFFSLCPFKCSSAPFSMTCILKMVWASPRILNAHSYYPDLFCEYVYIICNFIVYRRSLDTLYTGKTFLFCPESIHWVVNIMNIWWVEVEIRKSLSFSFWNIYELKFDCFVMLITILYV